MNKVLTNSTTYHTFQTEVKGTLKISLPLIASQLILALSGFIGTAIVAHLNKDALAASILVNMIFWTLTVLFLGILNATSVLVAQQYGAKDYSAISKIMGQAFLLAAILCLPIMLTLFTSPYLLALSTQPAIVLDYAQHYLHSLIWCAPGLLFLITLEQFVTGLGRARAVLAISILEVPLEITLIYGLVFGKFGLPACGIAGVGYGFTIAFTLTALILALYLATAQNIKPYKIYSTIGQYHSRYFKELVKIGWPIGGMYLIEVGAFAVATFFMAHYNSNTLAAHQIAFQYLGLTINIVFGMAQAVTIRIGQAAGRNDYVGVQYATYVGMILSCFCMLIIAILYFTFPQLLISLDLNTQQPLNAEVISQASTMLAIVGIFQIADNFRLIEVGALRGLKDTKYPMVISFLSFWLIGLACAYWFTFILHWPGSSIWWGLTIGIASGAIILFFRTRHILKTINLTEMVKI